jgi:tetrahydromethanopterin S-methyltransferase subunit G
MTDHEVRLSLVEQNYQHLENRLQKVETKLDDIHKEMKSGQGALIKVIVGTAGTIIASVISLVVVLLMS